MKLKLLIGFIGFFVAVNGELIKTKRYNYGKDLCDFDMKSVLKRIPSLTDLSMGDIVETYLNNESFEIKSQGVSKS